MQNIAWYIIKRANQHCEIISAQELANMSEDNILEKWGSFNSQGEAIAKRVGLIRVGKCQPL